MGHFGTNPNEKEGNLITNSSFGFGESPLTWYSEGVVPLKRV